MKKSKIIILVVSIFLVIYIVFTLVCSNYYSGKVKEIIDSSFYTNCRGYLDCSEYISKEDYKKFNCAPDENRRQIVCESSVFVSPYDLLFDSRQTIHITEKDFLPKMTDDMKFYYRYEFDMDFDGFDFYISNVKRFEEGMK